MALISDFFKAFLDGEKLSLNQGTNYVFLDMNSPSKEKPVFLKNYEEEHNLNIDKFFTLRVQQSRNSELADKIYTKNRKWFLQVESYSVEEAKQFNSQFGFEEFEDESSTGEAKKVPVFQQIIRGMLLGMTVEFDKLSHSNLKFHVYSPPEPAESPVSATEKPVQGFQKSAAEPRLSAHKCLFAVTINNLEGNVAVLFKRVPDDSSQATKVSLLK